MDWTVEPIKAWGVTHPGYRVIGPLREFVASNRADAEWLARVLSGEQLADPLDEARRNLEAAE